MAKLNQKAIRSLSKLMEAGFADEKAITGMTMDDILSLPGITIAEMGLINEIQKAVKGNKVITFLGGANINAEKLESRQREGRQNNEI